MAMEHHATITLSIRPSGEEACGRTCRHLRALLKAEPVVGDRDRSDTPHHSHDCFLCVCVCVCVWLLKNDGCYFNTDAHKCTCPACHACLPACSDVAVSGALLHQWLPICNSLNSESQLQMCFLLFCSCNYGQAGFHRIAFH